MDKDAAPKKLTAEEFAEWVARPEHADRWFELVHCQVIELPPTTKRQGEVCVHIGYFLSRYAFQIGKGYVTSNDAGVILERDPDTVRGPDIAYFDDARTFDEIQPGYGETPPRLAVEVLSPDNRADRITRKITDYLRNGVDVVWLVDPEIQVVTIYRRDKGPEVVEAHQEITAEGVLPGFRCPLAEFFLLPGEAARGQGQAKSG